MAIGWIRAWAEEYDRLFAGEFATPNARAEFRRQFGAELRDAPADDAAVVRRLVWDREVELPDGLSSGPWTRVRVDGDEGFIVSAHLVEIAFVDRGRGRDPYTASLVRGNGEEIDLLWGDLVQIRRREGDTCYVRARGVNGRIDTDRLTATPLLEVYFIDVGQGDGVLVRTPEGRHLLVDGGLPRSNQMTGKNAADFVDWKFFSDYGHHAIDLDAVVASHCDYDHYGGLWDLVRHDASRDDELDVLSVRIGAFYHAGLSRWEERSDSAFPHRDRLGPNDDGWFVRLLEDRADADAAIVNGADEELQGYWKWFIGDIIERNADVAIERLG
ncbi:MAG: MBL fold metallo-hydrolase, partial [Gammaproteobacteria bacterium]|nr:MBL fold metallo-hydrolase [Gammaproteobacteria bacterium]NIR85035.1 MBL fold metallo-hydrolase [Gammaproteobacteria bacterium]NIR88302.1 MBL fold metallo-hydrolase [Gammaproteobacteria bacterium]NIU06082.1 MBL fold metallo-hydrolase [Gammaproteobacteria bacterium]NIV73501.1 MBL fold metallo-hydrolase [Gammaproteobacteria bacterium]